VKRKLGASMRNLAPIVLALFVFPCSLPAQVVAPESKPIQQATSSENQGQSPITEINEFTKLAYEGGTQPLTTTPVCQGRRKIVPVRRSNSVPVGAKRIGPVGPLILS